MPISVKEFNRNQVEAYNIYREKCIANGVEPRGQERYYPTIGVKYGFVVEQPCNGIVWKKRKSDFN